MAGSRQRLLISTAAVLGFGALGLVICLALGDAGDGESTVRPRGNEELAERAPKPGTRERETQHHERERHESDLSPDVQGEPGTDGTSLATTLRELRASAPTSNAESAFASWSKGVRETSTAVFELTALLESDVRIGAPPFRGVWMFGRNDEQWVQSVTAAYRSGVVAAIEQIETKKGRSLSADERRPIRAEWRNALRGLVKEIATARYAQDDETQRRFADRRMLSQIPEDSADHKWLEICAQKLAPLGLVTHFPELLEFSDISFLSGADMQRVERIGADIDRALFDAGLLPSSPDCRDVLDVFARQFRDVVAPRRP